MNRSTVPITGEVLKWARHESGYSLAETAAHLGVDESEIIAWETEESQPIRTQVEQLAHIFRRQRTLFLLPSPPDYSTPERMKRTPGRAGRQLTPDELFMMRKLFRLQEIIALILDDTGTSSSAWPSMLPISVMPNKARSWTSKQQASAASKLPISVTPDKTAAVFKSAVGIADDAMRCENVADLEFLRSCFENSGVLVFFVEMGASRDSLRGFTFLPEINGLVPLVVVNSSYSIQAQAFALLHGAGHVLVGAETVYAGCAPDHTDDSRMAVESWCDRFAAYCLMPEGWFMGKAEDMGITSSCLAESEETVTELAESLLVSPTAAAVHLWQLGLLGIRLSSFTGQETPEGDMRKREPVPERKVLNMLGNYPVRVFLDAYDHKFLNIINLADYLDLKVAEIDRLREIVR